MKILLELYFRFIAQIITYYYYLTNFNETITIVINKNKCASNLKTSSN